MIRYLITLKDIGLRLILKRIFRHLHILIDHLLPENFIILFYKLNTKNHNFLEIKRWPTFFLDKEQKIDTIYFNFLNLFPETIGCNKSSLFKKRLQPFITPRN